MKPLYALNAGANALERFADDQADFSRRLIRRGDDMAVLITRLALEAREAAALLRRMAG